MPRDAYRLMRGIQQTSPDLLVQQLGITRTAHKATNLRKKAEGQACFVQIPGVCTHDTTTTVLAHLRRGGVAGMAIKPPDICGVVACDACHGAIDRRSSMGGYTADAMDGFILEGQQRWLLYCIQQGWISITC